MYFFHTLINSPYYCRFAVDWVSCYMDSVSSVCIPREYNYKCISFIHWLTPLTFVGLINVWKKYICSCILVEYRQMIQSPCNKKPNLLQAYKCKGSCCRLGFLLHELCIISLYSTRIQIQMYFFHTLINSPYICRLAVDWVSCYMDSVSSVCIPREYNYKCISFIHWLTPLTFVGLQ